MKGLSLTRKTGESCVFRVGDQEVVVIVEEAGVGRVRLRLVANQSVVIMRRELEQPSR
jgi:sRNA-binding carbon storage regulator CsrA